MKPRKKLPSGLTYYELKLLCWERDKWICQYCGKNMQNAYGRWIRYKDFGWGKNVHMWKRPTIDHVIPVSKGGKSELKNLVTSCCYCNNKKGSKIYEPQKSISNKS